MEELRDHVEATAVREQTVALAFFTTLGRELGVGLALLPLDHVCSGSTPDS